MWKCLTFRVAIFGKYLLALTPIQMLTTILPQMHDYAR